MGLRVTLREVEEAMPQVSGTSQHMAVQGCIVRAAGSVAAGSHVVVCVSLW